LTIAAAGTPRARYLGLICARHTIYESAARLITVREAETVTRRVVFCVYASACRKAPAAALILGRTYIAIGSSITATIATRLAVVDKIIPCISTIRRARVGLVGAEASPDFLCAPIAAKQCAISTIHQGSAIQCRCGRKHRKCRQSKQQRYATTQCQGSLHFLFC